MRLRIFAIVVVILGLAGGLKYRMLQGEIPREVLHKVIAVDAAAAVVVMLLSIIVVTAYLAIIRDIVRGLTAYLDGRREHRVPSKGRGLLAQMGQKINEILAAQTGDGSGGPTGYKRVVVPGETRSPGNLPLESSEFGGAGYPKPDAGEDVGPVRVRPRAPAVEAAVTEVGADVPVVDAVTLPENAAIAARYDTEISGPSEAPISDAEELGLAQVIDGGADEKGLAEELNDPGREVLAMPQASKAIAPEDDLGDDNEDDYEDEHEDDREEDRGDDREDEIAAADREHEVNAPDRERERHQESAITFVPALSSPGAVSVDSEEERRELYHSYRSAKQQLGENIDDLDFEGFQALLREVTEQLLRERGCTDVRFDVRVAQGAVALQPRLIRQKED